MAKRTIGSFQRAAADGSAKLKRVKRKRRGRPGIAWLRTCGVI